MAEYLGFTPEEKGYRFEPLRKFRWELVIGGADAQTPLRLVLKTCTRPGVTFDNVEVHHYNDRFYLAGKAVFDEIELVAYDSLVSDAGTQSGKYASKLLEEWRDAVYDPKTNIMLPAEGGNGIGYKKDCVLKQMDGSGNDLLVWQLLGCWPRVVKSDELDYTSSEVNVVNCTMRIDKSFILA